MDLREKSLELHRENKGKLEMKSKIKIENKDDLALVYTPGVAEPCKEIFKDEKKVYNYTSKGNVVAIVTDGTAVLGLGDIGPYGAIPVMEGKALLFKEFSGIDGIPICLDTKDTEEIIQTIKLISPTFGGINLEDISAPRCFEIERRLQEELSIPVFHDDQYGTAIVVVAGVLNALKVVNKEIESVKIVINGAGAAGMAIGEILESFNPKDILICDREGIIYSGRRDNTSYKEEIGEFTNKNNIKGKLEDALEEADIFIGVSAGKIVDEKMIKKMEPDSIVFALANPVPEIHPDKALSGGAKIIATGRSDFPNQINNVLAFPGIFKGALSVKASRISEDMKLAAAYAIAESVKEDELRPGYIIPNPFDKKVAEKVAQAVANAAKNS